MEKNGLIIVLASAAFLCAPAMGVPLYQQADVSVEVDFGLGGWNETIQTARFVEDVGVLALVAQELYLQPGRQFEVHLEVSQLGQAVNGCQAIIGFESMLSALDVADGGPPWNDLIYWATPEPGKIDLAVGVGLAQGEPTSTSDDGIVAVITFKVDPGAQDGVTRIWFRPDVSDVESTILADTSANPLYPAKEDSQTIIIDSTPPVLEITSAKQNGTELIGTGAGAGPGTVEIVVAASDAPAGLDGIPQVRLTLSDGTLTDALSGSANGDGTFTYTYHVTASTPSGTTTITATVSDLAGNPASDTAAFDVITAVLTLNAQELLVCPGKQFEVNLEVSQLAQPVNGCQAIIGHENVLAVVGVADGGAPWSDLVYWAAPEPGKLDLAAGLGLAPGEPTSTTDDGTVSVITFEVDLGAEDGQTYVWFRPDVNDIESTMLADTSADPVYPLKRNSQTIIIDATPPAIEITSATQGGAELIGTGVDALQGTVEITVAASDLHGLDGIPEATLTFDDESVSPSLGGTDNGDGTFTYTYDVTASTPNGVTTITAAVFDLAGNPGADTAEFSINKNEISVTVELEKLSPGPSGITRTVTFVATGGTRKAWSISLYFAQDADTAATVLTDVPDGTTGLSAKTAWNLRRKLAVDLGTNGQAAVHFTGSNRVLGGDLDGTNEINLPDWIVLKSNWFTTYPQGTVADINGDGVVNIPDYNIMKCNWFTNGDEE